MTKAEILAALPQMSTQDQLEIIEAATKLIRAELLPSSNHEIQSSDSSKMVEVMQVHYQMNSDLNLFADVNTRNI